MKKLKSLSEQVYDYIVSQIKLGNLPDGSHLSEAELIEQLKISRTPIREALIQLSADGIVQNVQRKGFFVKAPTRQALIDNYNIIARLDIYAAELTMDILSEKDLKQMETLAHHMDFAIAQQDYDLYLEKQEAFHNTYLLQCNNQHLADMIHHLLKKYIPPVAGYDASSLFQSLEESNKMHHQIAACFREKNLDHLGKILVAYWLSVANQSDTALEC